MTKKEIAEVFEEIGALLELKGENPFKSRAYLNAARALEGMNEPLDKAIAEERLAEVKGIGESIQKKILELITTGKLVYYEELKAATPPGLVLMLEIPGIGPKKIKALHEKLKILSVAELEAACQAHKVRELPGFGEMMRMESMKITKNAILSRNLAVVVDKALVICLPGKPSGAVECLSFVVGAIPHCIEVLQEVPTSC